MRTLLSSLSLFVLCHLSVADTVILPVSADTFIFQRFADRNAGAHAHVAAGSDGSNGAQPRRGLYRFDTSAIPFGSTVTSATLQLNVVISGPVNSNFQLHRALRSWTEGRGTGNNGATALAGESTWNSRRDSERNWGGVGGLASVDFVTSLSATTPVLGLGAVSFNGAGLLADVQHWVDQPDENFGWFLISDAEASERSARGFGSREHADPASRPVLQVGFIPPDPVVVRESPLGGSLQWTGPTGGVYDVQLSREMTDTGIWFTASSPHPSSQTGTNVWNNPELWDDPELEGNRDLFHRVSNRPEPSPFIDIELETVASGLVSPIHLTHAGDGSGRLFVVEQTGVVRVIDAAGQLSATNYLDVTADMVSINAGYDERGLLGLAFHPGYETNGLCYVYFSAPGSGNHESVVREYKVSADPNQVDPASARDLLRFSQPQSNHNGGMLEFGPDGYLYIASGDGGGGGDDDNHGPIGNGQNLNTLLGKLLRIDVSPTNSYAIPPDNPFVGMLDVREEIYCYGLRNPYRFSFDRGGERRLFLPDVGQRDWEEINIGHKGGNYGWRIVESHHGHDLPLGVSLSLDLSTLVWPIHEYVHGPLGISVAGGYLYRGPSIPELDGQFIFGDFSTSFGSPDGALYALEELSTGAWVRRELRLAGNSRLGRFVKGFGEDEAGNVYVLSSADNGPAGTTGDVRRFR